LAKRSKRNRLASKATEPKAVDQQQVIERAKNRFEERAAVLPEIRFVKLRTSRVKLLVQLPVVCCHYIELLKYHDFLFTEFSDRSTWSTLSQQSELEKSFSTVYCSSIESANVRFRPKVPHRMCKCRATCMDALVSRRTGMSESDRTFSVAWIYSWALTSFSSRPPYPLNAFKPSQPFNFETEKVHDKPQSCVDQNGDANQIDRDSNHFKNCRY
jgi:hypothetical protein